MNSKNEKNINNNETNQKFSRMDFVYNNLANE